MLEYDRTDISEGIDINKTNATKECDICHYWYFLDKNYKHETYLCNGCHDLMMLLMLLLFLLSKDDAINIMKSSNFKKSRSL